MPPTPNLNYSDLVDFESEEPPTNGSEPHDDPEIVKHVRTVLRGSNERTDLPVGEFFDATREPLDDHSTRVQRPPK